MATPLPAQETLILTVGMDDRKQAVFRMAFKMYSKTPYRLLETGEQRSPALAIVDIDSADAKSVWTHFRKQYPDLPTLIVSVAPLANAPAPVLRKPVRMETLFPHLEDLRNGKVTIDPAAPWPEAAPSPVLTAVQPAPTPTRPMIELKIQEIEYFDPEISLIGLVKMVARDAISATVTNGIGQALMIISPETAEVQLLVPTAQLAAIACDPSQQFHARAPQQPDSAHVLDTWPLNSALWQVGVWSANGRLLKQVRPGMALQLKHWPNLTRLAAIPHALRLSAFLTRSPVNPVLTVRMLQITPAELFNFLAAAHSIDILLTPTMVPAGDIIPERRIASSASPATPAITPPPSPQRGFLSRLLKKIAGL